MTCKYTFTDQGGSQKTLEANEFKAWLAKGNNLAFLRGEPYAQQQESAGQGKVEAISPMQVFSALFKALRDGTATLDEYKSGFDTLMESDDAIKSELSSMTKDAIFKAFPAIKYRYKNEKKSTVISAAYSDMLSSFALGESISYMMGEKYEDVIRRYVDKATNESIKAYAENNVAEIEASKERATQFAEAISDPKTLDDYVTLLRTKIQDEGMTFKDARMSMTPAQRSEYDELSAEKTRDERKARTDQQRDVVAAPAEAVGATEIIKTKHTKHGHDLWQFQLERRVPPDEFKSLVSQAKRMGGDYSSYRGNGAVPGWQFRTEDAAIAFRQLVAGDASAAQDIVQQQREAFKDDRSQSAVERLNEMADRLEDRADESLGRDRKANTSRRAGMAARADASANADKALAKTMRNIASAIESGTTKFLDRVRQKAQVEMLQGFVRSAHYDALRDKYPSYADYEKHKDAKPTAEAADYAVFPSYSAYRSDLARLGRQLSENDGTKKLGAVILKVADDVTDAYLKFAKDNLHKVSTFSRAEGSPATFSSKSDAEEAIKRSGFKGKAIVLPFKRGENIIIMSPAAANEAGIWGGDGDKRITLKADFSAEVVEKSKGVADVPWQFQSTYDSLKRLSALGIETPQEFRAALREFIGLKEEAAAPDKVKEMERAMVGRRNDGLDFFPTPASVAQQMVESAEIKEGMTVLEPSAGMGHIAEQIREAGVEPDVVEMSNDRSELLEAKGFNVVGRDFMDVKGEYDRIIMNPPFSDRRDIAHVQHAYSLLKPGGRLVAIMGEGSFFGGDKKATAFREWLNDLDGTSEKLDEGTFLDPSLPVNTGVNARMVVIDKPSEGVALFSRAAPFYSQLTRAFEQAKADKQTGNQWAQWLKGNAPKLGIKADEMQWSGMLDYLELRGTDKVTKAEIADYLSGNGVTVQDVVKGSGDWAVYDGEENRYFGTRQEAEDYARKQGINITEDTVFPGTNRSDGHAKFSTYWASSYKDGIPGTYREILVTLPVEQSVPTFEQWNESREFRGDDKGTQEQYDNDVGFYAKRGAYGNRAEQFNSPHWQEPNVLVHLRLDEVIGDGGKRYVRVGEIQSDWNQSRTQGKEVPDAPFSDTRAWVSLGIKRAIQHAISVNADGVIFGTGQQNADLYDLSKQVSEIEIRPQKNGTLNVYADGKLAKATTTKDLADVVGKDLAKKAIEDGAESKIVKYTGDALKVGGHGMDAFYDTIVPSVARDVLKKSKIGTLESINAAGVTHQGFALDADVREQVNADGLPLFQKPTGTGRSMTTTEVTAAIMPIRKLWKNAPPIVIVDNINHKDVPEKIRAEDAGQRAAGATGGVAGVFHGGKVYLVADNISSAQDAVTVLFHESLGHYGLRGVFGDALGTVLNQVMLSHNKAFMDKARAYGYATSIEQAREKVQAKLDEKGLAKPSNFEELAKATLKSDRNGAAEEVLAELAQDKPELNLVQKAIAAIKTFLRNIGLLDQAKMADDEIINNFILPARGFVERGERMKNEGGVAFSRKDAGDMANKIERALDRMGISNWRSSSRQSESQYISFEVDDETTLKIRISNHDLPDRYESADFDVATEGSRAFTNTEDWVEAVKFAAEKTGKEVPANVKAILTKRNKPVSANAEAIAHAESKVKIARKQVEAIKKATTRSVRDNVYKTGWQVAGVNESISKKIAPTKEDAISKILAREESNLAKYEGELSALINGNDATFSRAEADQFTETERAYGGREAYDKAKAAGETKLNYRQWVQVRTPAFKAWFGGSKVVDVETGEPLVVYHGTKAEFTVFDKSKAFRDGKFFFTADKSLAENYGGRIVEAYLKSDKLLKTTTSGKFIDALNEKVISDRFDGIEYKDTSEMGNPIHQIVVLDPNQIKSAIGNNGDFSLDNNDINFSRSAQQTIQQSQAIQQQSIIGSTKDWLAGKGDDVMPAALGVLTLKHLADVSSKVLPQIGDYVKLTDKMQADRNKMMSESGEIITKWQKWAGKNRKMQDTLSELMSQSTISGQHPGQPYAPIDLMRANRELAKAQGELLRATNAEEKRILNQQIKETKELIDYESSGKRKADYDALRKIWDTQLDDTARGFYEEVRKHYAQRAHDTYQTLVDRINNSAMSGKAALLERMRKEYEIRRVRGVYFPLARQGDYWINATDPNGERVFMMFDTSKELKKAQRAFASGGFTEVTSGRKVDNESNAGMNAGFVLDVMNTISDNVSDQVVSDAMRDEVYQLFLKTMPDMSMRKALIHRKKVSGYSNDVLRGLAIRSQHMAHQISRMRVSQQLQNFMSEMRKDAKDNPSVHKSALLNEMQKRHQWVMNPQDSSWANKLTGLGFLWYLGASPAAAAVNLTQLGVTTLPVLAAKHGFIKSQIELTKAMPAAFGKGMNTAEQAMIQSLIDAGVIETTMAHDVSGIGSTGTEGYNPVWNKTIGSVAWMFHQAEVFNRKITALAAYRLALSKPGTTNDQAIAYAQDVIWESHFDYSNLNRSRYMQPNIAKVLLLFKQYALNVSYYLLSNAYKAMAGETKQIKHEAMVKLGGTMAVTFTLAGVSGLPVFGMIAGMAAAVMALGGGDDDEPFNFETAMYTWMKKEFGTDIANLVMNGPTNAVTGIDTSSRASMGEMWIRSPDRELEGKALAHHYLEQIAGPVAGIPISFMAGLQLMQDNHMERGFEKMVPKAARDLLQAARFNNEGALNLRDAPLVEKDDMTLFDVLVKANGFTPAQLAEVYDSNNRVTNVQKFLQDRRQTLINRAWLAKSAGDNEAWGKNMEHIKAWNEKYPKDRITMATLHKSFRSRKESKDNMQNGIIVNKKYRDAVEEVR